MLTTMSLLWGVRCFYYDKMESTDQTFDDVEDFLKQKGFVREGEVIINTASMPIHQKFRTNTIKLQVVK